MTRPKDVQDNAVPSGNAVAAEVLLRLHAWTGESVYRAAAERALRTVVPYVARYATGFARWLSAMDLSLAAVQEVAIVGRADDPETLALLGEVRRGYRPNQVDRPRRGPGRQRGPAAGRSSGGRWPPECLPLSRVRVPACPPRIRRRSADSSRSPPVPPEAGASPREAGPAIRDASPAQYTEIGELTVRAYATVGDPLQGSPTYAAYEDELRDVAGRAETCQVLVAVDAAGRILGAVTYVPGPGTPWSESEREGEAGFRALAVDPAARGNGVGRALAMACVDRARAMGRHGVAIYTRPSMNAAQGLYELLGFARTPSRDWQFEPGQWLWSYVLSL